MNKNAAFTVECELARYFCTYLDRQLHEEYKNIFRNEYSTITHVSHILGLTSIYISSKPQR